MRIEDDGSRNETTVRCWWEKQQRARMFAYGVWRVRWYNTVRCVRADGTSKLRMYTNTPSLGTHHHHRRCVGITVRPPWWFLGGLIPSSNSIRFLSLVGGCGGEMRPYTLSRERSVKREFKSEKERREKNFFFFFYLAKKREKWPGSTRRVGWAYRESCSCRDRGGWWNLHNTSHKQSRKEKERIREVCRRFLKSWRVAERGQKTRIGRAVKSRDCTRPVSTISSASHSNWIGLDVSRNIPAAASSRRESRQSRPLFHLLCVWLRLLSCPRYFFYLFIYYFFPPRDLSLAFIGKHLRSFSGANYSSRRHHFQTSASSSAASLSAFNRSIRIFEIDWPLPSKKKKGSRIIAKIAGR